MAEEYHDPIDDFLGEETPTANGTTEPEAVEPTATAEAEEALAVASTEERDDQSPAEPEEAEINTPEVAEPDTKTEPNKIPVPPKKKFSNRGYKRLEHENLDLRRRVALLEERLAPKDEPPAKPKRSDFSSDEEYLDATSHWNVADALSKQRQAAEQQRKQIEADRAWAAAWDAKVNKCFPTPEEKEEFIGYVRDGYGAVAEMIEDPELANYIYGLDEGPAIQKYLWTHPKALAKINSAHRYEKIDYVKRIRDFVGVPSAKPTANPRPQPTPIGSARTGKGTPSLVAANASAEQYFDILAGNT